MGSQGKQGMQMATMRGKESIVINKLWGGQIIRTAGGENTFFISYSQAL